MAKPIINTQGILKHIAPAEITTTNHKQPPRRRKASETRENRPKNTGKKTLVILRKSPSSVIDPKKKLKKYQPKRRKDHSAIPSTKYPPIDMAAWLRAKEELKGKRVKTRSSHPENRTVTPKKTREKIHVNIIPKDEQLIPECGTRRRPKFIRPSHKTT